MLIDDRAVLEVDPRIEYAHFVNFRPGDGQVCLVNPPRFSWAYDPEVVPRETPLRETAFTLQLSKSGDFSTPELEITDTPYSFYNALPVLDKAVTWHWRVGYRVEGSPDPIWSETRRFTFAPDAVEWDRTVIDRIGDYLNVHPRTPFSAEQWDEIKGLHERDPVAAEIRAGVLRHADGILQRDWWDPFPDGDEERWKGGTTRFEGAKFYANVGQGLETVAFALKLTGNEKYAGVRERFLKLAAWPPGGFSSPEGMGKADAKNSTKITQNLSFYLDWFYDELSTEDRQTLLDSIQWRLAHNVNDYSWKKEGQVNVRGIAAFCMSHPYEDFMWTLPAALATYEHLSDSREAVDLGLHYLTGVTNPFGPEEAWNEGMAYGGWKLATLLDTALTYNFTVPDLHLERNPYWRQIGDFFSRLSPLGIQFGSFGNYANSMNYIREHNGNFRKLAYLTGDARMLHNWRQCHTWEGKNLGFRTPPIDLAICLDGLEVSGARTEPTLARPFAIAGWVMAGSRPPSDASAYADSVGMITHCRPRGGYSHSFFNENAFDIHAYGEVVAAGGAGTENSNPFARSTASHNSILVDGREQEQEKLDPAYPWAGRLIAYREAPGCVYWAGDATKAYQKTPYLERAIRHTLFLRDRYFVVLDDLAVDPDHGPSRFTWLYHVRQDVPVTLRDGGFRYQVGKTRVRVAHCFGEVSMENLKGQEGYRNPVTGDDTAEETHRALFGIQKQLSTDPKVELDRITANNIWITNATPATEHTFLAAILPWRESEEEPRIEERDGARISVRWADGVDDTISFGEEQEGDTFCVDLEKIRSEAKRREEALLNRR